MPPSLDARPDHVAVAVPDMGTAWERWHGRLGGSWFSEFHYPGRFLGRQLRYHGGAKLELLAPSPDDDGSGFLPRYLARHGAGVHHVTLKVPDLVVALDRLDAAGIEAVDVDLRNPGWQEAFLRPSQVGGIVVQVACSDRTDEQWATAQPDGRPEPIPTAGPRLLGPVLGHPDPETAAGTWMLFGASVSDVAGDLLVRWHGTPLTIRLVHADRAGPLGVRFAGTDELAGDPQLGAAVVVEEPTDTPGVE